MNERITERAEIEERFAESVQTHFGNHLSLALSSGSFAYAGATKGKSDLDIMTVLRDGIRDVPRKELLEMIQGFSRDYVAIHRQYDYAPDDVFPGEYITEANVEDAIAGRGFHATESGIYLPPASNEYYLEDPERYFRAWRSMLAFSKHIAGEEEKFDETKIRAWESIVLYLLSQMDEEEVSAERIMDILTGNEDKWQSVGVTQKCLTFREDEIAYVERTLVRLKMRGLLSADAPSYGIATEEVQTWSSALASDLQSGNLQRSAFLLNKDNETELTAFTKTLLAPAEVQSKIRLETERYSASPMKNRYLGDCIQVVYTATQEEQERDSLTDEHIIIFVKAKKDPIGATAESGKLFGKEHFKEEEVLLRISSACVHGSLGDMDCTCHEDTVAALQTIQEKGCGVFVYMPQDALGRGLRDKVRDHRLTYGVSEEGEKVEPLSTEESMAAMYPEGYDIRNFTVLRTVFEELGLSEVEFVFLGKNEQKINKIRAETGISIASTMHWK